MCRFISKERKSARIRAKRLLEYYYVERRIALIEWIHRISNRHTWRRIVAEFQWKMFYSKLLIQPTFIILHTNVLCLSLWANKHGESRAPHFCGLNSVSKVSMRFMRERYEPQASYTFKWRSYRTCWAIKESFSRNRSIQMKEANEIYKMLINSCVKPIFMTMIRLQGSLWCETIGSSRRSDEFHLIFSRMMPTRHQNG